MLPTLLIGDFILVNKFTYGIRLPVINKKIVDINAPQRGEVMVFRYPENPSLDYIKRIVGVPGDKVSYQNKRLSINGQEVKAEADGEYNYVETGPEVRVDAALQEMLAPEHEHAILINPDIPTLRVSDVKRFPFRENCVYNEAGFTCTVPPGNYFMMGDNRDSSSDSRYWGFVPDENIVGKAFLIWWNFDEFKRIGRYDQITGGVMKKQRGVSLSGLLMVSVVLILVLLLGFQAVPAYTRSISRSKRYSATLAVQARSPQLARAAKRWPCGQPYAQIETHFGDQRGRHRNYQGRQRRGRQRCISGTRAALQELHAADRFQSDFEH